MAGGSDAGPRLAGEVPHDWDSTGRGRGSGVQPFVDRGRSVWVSITGAAERKEVREAEAEGVGRCRGCGIVGGAGGRHRVADLLLYILLGKYTRGTYRTP